MLSNNATVNEKATENTFWTEWVDLQLDPDDYPAASGRYLTIVKKNYHPKIIEICYYNDRLGVFTIRQKAQNVIAWASLPPMLGELE